MVHVAEVEVSETTGMGRVAYYWRQAFHQRGYEFVHLGPTETGHLMHRTLFPWAAYATYRKLGKRADLFLVHEPAAGAFVGTEIPAFVFSHGLERRGGELETSGPTRGSIVERIQKGLTAPLWKLRAYSRDRGLRGADGALLINQEDAAYAIRHYRMPPEKIWVFRNGVYRVNADRRPNPDAPCRILFLGSWLSRKGTETLARAAAILQRRGVKHEWLLAGTGRDRNSTLANWPSALIDSTIVVPRFAADQEGELFAGSSIFVLPSFFEGQPLALLEAMAWGRCCIASDCCGQRDLIKDRHTGLLHPPGDAETLARLIQECVENADLRSELGRNAARSVEDRTWDAVSDEVVSYIESVLDRMPRGRTGR